MSFRKLSQLRGVVLDADGTLYTLRSSVGTLYSEVLSRFSIFVNPRDLDEVLPTVWKAFEGEYLARAEDYRTDPVRERRLWSTFIERMLEQAGVGASSPAITDTLYAEFARGDIRVLAEGVVDFLQTARKLGLITAIATNNDGRVQSTISELGLVSYVTRVFWAGQLAWKKPSPHFFQEIARRLGIDGSQLLHVGNDFDLDVRAAQSAGWEALLFDPDGRGPSPKIHSFAALERWVEERGV